MALWAQIQQLGTPAMQRIKSAYGTGFPIEVRHFFGEWIEEQKWAEVEEEDNHAEAQRLLAELVQRLDTRVQEWENSEENFIFKLKLQEVSQQFKDMYGSNPMQMVQVVNSGIKTEHALVDQAQEDKAALNSSNLLSDSTAIQRSLDERLDLLRRRVLEANTEINNIQYKQESLVITINEKVPIEQQLAALQQQPNGTRRMEGERSLVEMHRLLETQIATRGSEVAQMKARFMHKYNDMLEEAEQVQHYVISDRVATWQRLQQKVNLGHTIDITLDSLQTWCRALAELQWQYHSHITRLQELHTHLPISQPPGQVDLLPHLAERNRKQIEQLVCGTFVIEKQPPQVLRTQARFSATVRMLTGSKLNMQFSPPHVKASILSEEQARGLKRYSADMVNESSGNIINNTSSVEYNQASGLVTATFRNMQLKSIKRVEKKGNETVTEEKFGILFQASVNVAGFNETFRVWTLSVPVVITVHVNQECNALATVVWDNGFAEPGREPFYVPDKASFVFLCEVLNMKFGGQAGCGRNMSVENVMYLGTKLNMPTEDTKSVVTWSTFNRENLPGRNFTFWQWFYWIMKLTKEHLSGPWRKGLIIGFVSKQRAQEMLLQSNVAIGTFLLRYSDGELGGVSIAWVNENKNRPGEKQVWNLSPFTERDFRIRGIGDRIKDLPNLVYLYPDIPKEQAFSEFWTKEDPIMDVPDMGYVETNLTTTINLPGLQQSTTPEPNVLPTPAGASLMGQQSPPRPDTAQSLTPRPPPQYYDTRGFVDYPPVQMPSGAVAMETGGISRSDAADLEEILSSHMDMNEFENLLSSETMASTVDELMGQAPQLGFSLQAGGLSQPSITLPVATGLQQGPGLPAGMGLPHGLIQGQVLQPSVTLTTFQNTNTMAMGGSPSQQQ